MNGYKANALKRQTKKDALLSQLIIMMGKFNIDYSLMSRLTGIKREVIKYGIQHPDHISLERLQVIMNAVLDYIEMIRRS